MPLTLSELRKKIEALTAQVEQDRQRIKELKERLAAADRKRASLPEAEQSRLDPVLDMLERELDYAKARFTEDEQNLIKLRKKAAELESAQESAPQDAPALSPEEWQEQAATANDVVEDAGSAADGVAGRRSLLGEALRKIQQRDFDGLTLQEIRALRMCYDRLLHRVNRSIKEDRLKSLIAAALRALDRMKKLPPESGNTPI